MAVLDVGWMNMNPEKEPIGIGHNMPLAAVDALPRVVAARSAGLGSRRTLAVDHRRRRLRRTSELFSRAPDKNADDPLPPARITPGIKIARPVPSSRAGTPAVTPATGSPSTGYREPPQQYYEDRFCAAVPAGWLAATGSNYAPRTGNPECCCQTG
jgi:hypothetical protein